jgi:uncharacterized protein Yka (UPF0111/DUF47 family)
MNKTKDQLLTMLLEHSRIIYSVISDMGVFYTGWAEDYEKNKEILLKKKNKMLLTEEDGDTIKIRLIQDYSEAGTQGLQSYLTLILKMDNVINAALEFVDILAFIGDSNKISDDMKNRYKKLINNTIQMADTLKITIKNLRDKPQEVFNNTTTIHEIENSIDSIFRDFLNSIYDNKELDIRLLLKIRDSIKILEELADRIHDIADLIRILIYQ